MCTFRYITEPDENHNHKTDKQDTRGRNSEPGKHYQKQGYENYFIKTLAGDCWGCYVCSMINQKRPEPGKIMTKVSVLNRVNVKAENAPAKSQTTVNAKGQIEDPNAPASPRLTYALYNANRAASKINGCKVFNDWHKQGLTVKEANELIAEYNKVTGYVYKPKTATKTTASVEVTAPAKPATKGAKKGGKVTAPVTPDESHRPTLTESKQAQMQAVKDLMKEGLITPEQLAETLKAIYK